MQFSKSWDEESIQKTIRGFKIAAGGAVLAGFVMLVPEINDYITSRDPISWTNILIAMWGSLSSGLINAGKQWLQGQNEK